MKKTIKRTLSLVMSAALLLTMLAVLSLTAFAATPICLSDSAVVSVGSTYMADWPVHAPSAMLDHDPATEWAAGGASDWVELYWGVPVTIDSIEALNRSNNDTQSFTIDYSDGTSQTVTGFDTSPDWAVSGIGKTVTSIKFNLTGTNNAGFSEITVMGTWAAGHRNITYSATPTASDSFAGYGPEWAIDRIAQLPGGS